MKHLIFLIHILSLMTGLLIISAGVLLISSPDTYTSIKGLKPITKKYLIFFSALTIFLIQQTLEDYEILNSLHFSILGILMEFVCYCAAGIMLYNLPLFCLELFNKPSTKNLKRFLMLLSTLSIAAFFIKRIPDFKIPALILVDIPLYGVILLSAGFLLLHRNESASPIIRSALKTISYVSLFFVPYLIFDLFVEHIPMLLETFPYGILSVPVFYLVFNLLTLYYCISCIRTLKLREDIESSEPDNSRKFYHKFGITPREEEIITLLMQGYTYNKISEELFISVPTVKTHIHNIYTKTNVSNKMQLMLIFHEV